MNDNEIDQQKNSNLITAKFANLVNWQDAVLRKTSINLAGHSTSISLEKPFLDILQHEAKSHQLSFAQLVSMIDDKRPPHINLSSALRLTALECARRHLLQV